MRTFQAEKKEKEAKKEWLSLFCLRIAVTAGIIIVLGVEHGFGKAKNKLIAEACRSARNATGSSGQNRMTKEKGGKQAMNDVFDEIEDGIIELDSPFAKKLGFTSDKFDGWLWKKGKYIYISFIISKKWKKGNFKRLLRRIEELGFGIKIPTPLGVMQYIVRKYGFKKTTEYFVVSPEIKEPCEVWVKEPRKVIKIEQK